MVTRGEREEEGKNQKYVINTLPYIKQISNKDILYNTGNNIQYLVITYNGNNMKKYIYIKQSLCCTSEANIML